MSAERNELAAELLAEIKAAPHIWIDTQLGPQEVTIDGAVDLTAVADKLIATGYRKPQPDEAVPLHTQWAVQWDAVGPAWPQEVHLKESHEDAASSIAKSAFPGHIVKRTVTDWEPAG